MRRVLFASSDALEVVRQRSFVLLSGWESELSARRAGAELARCENWCPGTTKGTTIYRSSEIVAGWPPSWAGDGHRDNKPSAPSGRVFADLHDAFRYSHVVPRARISAPPENNIFQSGGRAGGPR